MLVYYNGVGDAHLRTFGIKLLEGRDFTERDTADSASVTVINETMARRYFAGRDPIGGRVRVGQRTVEVVGVARDGKYGNVTESARAFIYLPLQQWYRADVVLVVDDPRRSRSARAGAARRGARARCQCRRSSTCARSREHLEITCFMQRMIASLLGAFGILALVLATVGLYGVIAAMAAQRTAEIGMRMALGAGALDIVALILRQAHEHGRRRRSRSGLQSRSASRVSSRASWWGLARPTV